MTTDTTMKRVRGVAAGATSAILSFCLVGCAPSVSAPPGMTRTEAEVFVRQQSVGMWSALVLREPRAMPALPEVTFVSSESWSAVMDECLRAADVPVRWGYTEGTTYPDIGAPDDVLVANFVCQSRYAVNPSEYLLTRTQLDYLYDYYANWLVPCLAMHGADTPQLPSRTSFAEQQGWWQPYQEVAIIGDRVDDATYRQWQEECPSYPGGLPQSGTEYQRWDY